MKKWPSPHNIMSIYRVKLTLSISVRSLLFPQTKMAPVWCHSNIFCGHNLYFCLFSSLIKRVVSKRTCKSSQGQQMLKTLDLGPSLSFLAQMSLSICPDCCWQDRYLLVIHKCMFSVHSEYRRDCVRGDWEQSENVWGTDMDVSHFGARAAPKSNVGTVEKIEWKRWWTNRKLKPYVYLTTSYLKLIQQGRRELMQDSEMRKKIFSP